jgi:sulfiredoxin
MLEKLTLSLSDIRVPVKRAKTLDPDKRDKLGEDILEHGMTTPIQVRADGAGFVLVEGLHRLEAMLALGETQIDAYLVRARLH